MTILIVNNLTIKDQRSGQALIKGLSFSLNGNSCLGLVGESGSGKSLVCKAIMGVLDPWLAAEGKILFDGRNLLRLDDGQMNGIRGARIGLIIQEAQSAFNPIYKIGAQMAETLAAHKNLGKKQARDLAKQALLRLKMPEPESVLLKYPHQLSGGMLQRVMGAVTLALAPEIIIADEPTTALDCIAQKEVLDQLLLIKNTQQAAMIFVSHDLGVVRRIADRVAVMREGEIVEQGPMEDIFNHPAESYTRRLAAANHSLGERFRAVTGRTEAA